MKTPARWVVRCVSVVMMGLILSACSQAPTPPRSTGGAATAAPAATEATPSSDKAVQPEKVTQAPAIANFQTQAHTIGFSADGKYFMHLESWRDTGAGIPNAAMQIVNLATNTCMAKGCVRTRFNESQAQQSTVVAETELMNQTQQLRQDLNLTAPVAGVTLPLLARSQAADGTEAMTVRLQNNQPLQLTMKQKQVASVMSGGTAEKDQAAMQIEVKYEGKTRSLGSLDKMHDWVQEFAIREVRQSPDGKAIAILVTAAERTFEGSLGRTLVQGFTLSSPQ